MDSGAFITPNKILFMAAGMAGDKEYKIIPRGFYTTLIQDAFHDLNMSSLFMPARTDYPMPMKTLTVDLPEDCIDVDEVYVFTGDRCVIADSKKLYWKRNFYTEGNGYIANNKGNNGNDPYLSGSSMLHDDKNLIRVNAESRPNNLLFYEIERGKLMISSACRSAGTKIHLKYKSTGGPMIDAPIIPLFYKTAIEDFVIEAALRFRMANEPAIAKNLAYSQQLYANRLDKEGFNGSWHTAVMLAKKMSTSKREDLKRYLGKAAWATGR